MPSGGHVTLHSLGVSYIDNGVEQVRLAMLATEIPTDDIIVIGKVRFAFLAPEYFVGSEIDVVRKTHGDLYRFAFPLPPTSQEKSWSASSTTIRWVIRSCLSVWVWNNSDGSDQQDILLFRIARPSQEVPNLVRTHQQYL
jgi:hypothetical protein